MNKLKELRIANGFTQEYVGDALGVGKSTVCKYESGAVALPQKAIDALCDLFNVSSDVLLGRCEIDDIYIEEKNHSKHIEIPLLGKVHAGMPMLAAENIEEYIPHSDNLQGGEYFYMEVEGDCMTGDFIPEGAIVLVRKQSHVSNNEIVVVRIEDEVVLRHIKFVGDHIVLIPSNPAYEPMIVTGGNVEIIGKVCEVRFEV